MYDKILNLRKEIEGCKACPLYLNRKNVVVGSGEFNKRVFLVGEAPGKNEDEQGLPFVGKAGKILDELLILAGLRREDIFITNIIKCRPPGNRDPTPEEVSACSTWLERQLAIMHPKIIITLGRISLAYFQNKYNLKKEPISKIHGDVIKINTLMWRGKLIPMYHPASALYNPRNKEKMMEDWGKLKELFKDS